MLDQAVAQSCDRPKKHRPRPRRPCSSAARKLKPRRRSRRNSPTSCWRRSATGRAARPRRRRPPVAAGPRDGPGQDGNDDRRIARTTPPARRGAVRARDRLTEKESRLDQQVRSTRFCRTASKSKRKPMPTAWRPSASGSRRMPPSSSNSRRTLPSARTRSPPRGRSSTKNSRDCKDTARAASGATDVRGREGQGEGNNGTAPDGLCGGTCGSGPAQGTDGRP